MNRGRDDPQPIRPHAGRSTAAKSNALHGVILAREQAGMPSLGLARIGIPKDFGSNRIMLDVAALTDREGRAAA